MHLKFPPFGSVYFQDAPIDPALKTTFEDEFCIVPHCDPIYWNCGPGQSSLCGKYSYDHGPCKSWVPTPPSLRHC